MLGESAGRTNGNPSRPTARRRMNDAERAKYTHTKDDPQQWPDPPVNTVMEISGRMLGVVLMLVVAVCGRYLIESSITMGDWIGTCMIMGAGHGLAKASRWGTTRRL